MEIYFQGVILAVCTFFIIGLLHPIVVKWEFYFGTKGWWLWLLGGIGCCVLAPFLAGLFSPQSPQPLREIICLP